MRQVNSIREIEEFLDENGEMVIGKNNKNNVIIMSMEEYREKMLRENIEKSLLESEQDIENGRVKDATEVFEELKTQYGI